MLLAVEAFSGKIKIECEKNILTPGKSTACSVLVDSDELLAPLDVRLVFPTVLNLDSIVTNEDVWTGLVEGKRLSLVMVEELKGENINVATFKITAKEIAAPSLDSMKLR